MTKKQEIQNMDKRLTWSSRFEFILTCISFAVGMGNIVRFPYLCFKNGGGAFLIPYILTLLLCGLPIAFMEFSLGQYVGLAGYEFWNLCPMFKGLGHSAVMMNCLIVVYFMYIIALALHYLVFSFSLEIPWSSCGNEWNTEHCVDHIMIKDINNSFYSHNVTEPIHENSSYQNILDANTENITRISAAEEYLYNHVLALSTGVSDINRIQWQLLLAFIVTWTAVFLVTIKGVKSSGKVVYITGLLPYVMLTVFVIRGATLPGSLEGVKYYIIPDWQRLQDPEVWFSGAQQIFFSLGIAIGCFITMSSYNKFNNNCLRDAVVATFVNSGTSLYGGFAVFSIVGYMAHEANIDIADVMQSGPGLAFIVYPRALATMPVPQVWSVLFFLMLLILGIGSQAVHFETVISSMVDVFPSLRNPVKRAILSASIITIFILIGSIFTTDAGMYIFTLIDWYATPFGLMIMSIVECIGLAWMYGSDKILENITTMTRVENKWLDLYLKSCWKFVAPVFVLLILIASIITWTPVSYGDYIYPAWTTAFGWCLAVSTIIPIPVVAVIKIVKSNGDSIRQKIISTTKPTFEILDSIKRRAHIDLFETVVIDQLISSEKT